MSSTEGCKTNTPESDSDELNEWTFLNEKGLSSVETLPAEERDLKLCDKPNEVPDNDADAEENCAADASVPILADITPIVIDSAVENVGHQMIEPKKSNLCLSNAAHQPKNTENHNSLVSLYSIPENVSSKNAVLIALIIGLLGAYVSHVFGRIAPDSCKCDIDNYREMETRAAQAEVENVALRIWANRMAAKAGHYDPTKGDRSDRCVKTKKMWTGEGNPIEEKIIILEEDQRSPPADDGKHKRECGQHDQNVPAICAEYLISRADMAEYFSIISLPYNSKQERDHVEIRTQSNYHHHSLKNDDEMEQKNGKNKWDADEYDYKRKYVKGGGEYRKIDDNKKSFDNKKKHENNKERKTHVDGDQKKHDHKDRRTYDDFENNGQKKKKEKKDVVYRKHDGKQEKRPANNEAIYQSV